MSACRRFVLQSIPIELGEQLANLVLPRFGDAAQQQHFIESALPSCSTRALQLDLHGGCVQSIVSHLLDELGRPTFTNTSRSFASLAHRAKAVFLGSVIAEIDEPNAFAILAPEEGVGMARLSLREPTAGFDRKRRCSLAP